MFDILNTLISYFLGCVVTFTLAHPLREWNKGYECAKAQYNNWELGFDEGYKSAEKHFRNFDEGFGQGFEAGFNVAFEYYNK